MSNNCENQVKLVNLNMHIVFTSVEAIESVLNLIGKPSADLVKVIGNCEGFEVFGCYETYVKAVEEAKRYPLDSRNLVALAKTTPADELSLIEHAARLLYFCDYKDVVGTHSANNSMVSTEFRAKVENKGLENS